MLIISDIFKLLIIYTIHKRNNFCYVKNKYSSMFILLVDNNRFYVSVLKEMLFKAGFNRIENVENGLDCILQPLNGDNPDVIIIDESQCYVNNVDVLKKIHNSRPESRIIVLTESEAPVNSNLLHEKGSTLCMSKDSITADNLPKILYDIFTQNINSSKKSSISKAFTSFRRSFSGTLNF